MENKSHALAAGLFIVIFSALLAAAAMWLTRDTSRLIPYELVGRVNVTGLQVQASVRLRGVPVGKVQSIALDPTRPGQVRVRIALNAGTPIDSSTVASLGYQGVTGLAFVQLDDAGDNGPLLPAGSQLPLKPGLMSRLSDQGERILGQIEQSGQRVNQLLSAENQQTLMLTLRQLGTAAAELQQLSAQVRKDWPQLAESGRDTLATLKTTSLGVGRSAEEARVSARAFRLVTERMYGPDGTLDRLDQGADILVATGNSLRLSTLPRLDETLRAASGATQHIGHLGQALADNPQSLLLGKPDTAPGPGEPGFQAPVPVPR